VHASNPARFLASYRAIAAELRLPGFDDPKANPLDLVYRWLLSESSGQWLLILDNADDVSFARYDHGNAEAPRYEFNIAQYLPQRIGGAVLITSRDNRAAFALTGQADRNVPVHPLNVTEAIALIDRKIPTLLGNENEREKLVSALELIPLALTQAAAYITRRQRMTIAKYLDFLDVEEEKEGSVLKTDEPDRRRDPEVPNSVVWA